MIHNRTDRPTCAASATEEQALRTEIGVGLEDLLILQVAPLDPARDHATALRTLEHVVWHHRNARLVLVGEGPERGRIERIIEERNLGPSVRLLGSRTDIVRLMQAADLYLHTSLSPGDSLTLIEAMSAGLPIVAAQVPGVMELVEEGLTGLLAPAGDDAALADCILRLARNPDLSQQMSQMCRARAQRFFEERPAHGLAPHLHEPVHPG